MTAVLAPNQAGDGVASPVAFAWPVRRPLLSAEWLNLVMLNYEIAPKVLKPYIPAGTELDFWEGKTYASIVGFQFLNARLFGIRVPGHKNFEEVNLRFYVRRRAEEGWRRGVVFIRELAPKRAVALTARILYGENYICVPMSHQIDRYDDSEAPERVEYQWKFRGQWRRVAVETTGFTHRPEAGSHEEYITEHYWGYSALPRGRAKEYLVSHRPWRISRATLAEYRCDVAALYGEPFAPYLSREPTSAFWVDGSAVRVYPGHRID
jgi:uncharacterized protein YqjF (DUF2071 family)